MMRPSSCSGIWQPCNPARSLNVPQTRGKYHDVFVRLKTPAAVLRPQDPGVVGQPAGGIGARVGVHQLPRRGHADGVAVKRELLRRL